MGDYVFRKWRSVRNGGTSLFSMLSSRMRVFVVITLCSLFLSSAVLFVATFVRSPFSDILIAPIFDTRFLSPAYLFFYISLAMTIVMSYVVYPIDRETERSRIDEFNSAIGNMLANEGIDEAGTCEAICASLEKESEYEMRRLEFRWGFVFTTLMLFAGGASAFLTDYLVSKTEEEFVFETWLIGAFVLAAILVVAALCYAFFSKRANTPRLKAKCAADLRIAFYMTRMSDCGSLGTAPKHMR